MARSLAMFDIIGRIFGHGSVRLLIKSTLLVVKVQVCDFIFAEYTEGVWKEILAQEKWTFDRSKVQPQNEYRPENLASDDRWY